LSRGTVPPDFLIEPLDRRHDRAVFCCGNDALDLYLRQQAGQDARKNVAAPFVLVAPGAKVVKGYYTLSMTAIALEKLPDAVARTLPRYPIAPATLLGRLAVDQSCRGSGVGRLLLADALKRGLRSEIAWAAVIVDAIDDPARAFYEHYGFIRFPDRPMRLFMMKRTVEQMFGERD
jgi:GNAT superfamily N-acetyltransferase